MKDTTATPRETHVVEPLVKGSLRTVPKGGSPVETLAILGGLPLLDTQSRGRFPVWPVVSESTGEKLKELYMSGQWSFNGSYEQQFCREFAEHHGVDHGVFMVNGTVTLECVLRALGIKAGDEVIVPALTWVATAMSAVYVGATPVFVDIDPETLCMDPERLEQAITARTKAIIPVHLYGSMADMEAIMAIGNRHGIAVIEDCAHAHGGRWDGRGVGSIGLAGSFSFQQSKNLTGGEGGICLTNDAELAQKLFRLKHIGYDSASLQGQASSAPEVGLTCRNYRATEFQALILSESLKVLDEQNQLRERNVKHLRELIAEVPGVRMQARGRKASLQSYYCAIFLLDRAVWGQVALSKVIEALNGEGFGFHPSYGPVYDHMLWNVSGDQYRISEGGCGVCEELSTYSVIGLAHQWLLGDGELMELIAGAFKKVYSNLKALQ